MLYCPTTYCPNIYVTLLCITTIHHYHITLLYCPTKYFPAITCIFHFLFVHWVLISCDLYESIPFSLLAHPLGQWILSWCWVVRHSLVGNSPFSFMRSVCNLELVWYCCLTTCSWKCFSLLSVLSALDLCFFNGLIGLSLLSLRTVVIIWCFNGTMGVLIVECVIVRSIYLEPVSFMW